MTRPETLHDISEAEHLRACDQRTEARYDEDRYEDGYWDARLHARLNGDTPERLKRESKVYHNPLQDLGVLPPKNKVWHRRRRLHRSAAVLIGCILGLALAHIPMAANNPRTTAAVLIYVLINVMVCGFFKEASRH